MSTAFVILKNHCFYSMKRRNNVQAHDCRDSATGIIAPLFTMSSFGDYLSDLISGTARSSQLGERRFEEEKSIKDALQPQVFPAVKRLSQFNSYQTSCSRSSPSSLPLPSSPSLLSPHPGVRPLQLPLSLRR